MYASALAMTNNLFADVPAELADELTETLVTAESVRIERIVSTGQASPEGFWYDQDEHEWVVLLAGSAAVPIALIEKTGEPRTQSRDVLIVYQVHDPSTVAVLEGHVNHVEDVLEAHREELGFDDLYSWFSEEHNTAQSRIYLPKNTATRSPWS